MRVKKKTAKKSKQKPIEPEVLDEAMSNVFKMLEPLAAGFFENQRRQIDTDNDARLKQIESNNAIYEKNYLASIERLNFERYKFNRYYLLLSSMFLAFFIIAAGLIFFLNKVNAGIFVLSHILAMISGVFAGLGIQKNVSVKGSPPSTQ